jgi:hypothetical protein
MRAATLGISQEDEVLEGKRQELILRWRCFSDAAW